MLRNTRRSLTNIVCTSVVGISKKNQIDHFYPIRRPLSDSCVVSFSLSSSLPSRCVGSERLVYHLLFHLFVVVVPTVPLRKDASDLFIAAASLVCHSARCRIVIVVVVVPTVPLRKDASDLFIVGAAL